MQEELPGKWEYYIDRLSGYIASSGKQYKNHAATIRRWAADDRAKENLKKESPIIPTKRARAFDSIDTTPCKQGVEKTMNKEDYFMSDYDNAIFRLATAQEAEPEDYTGEDGLLYCGNCRQPKKPTSGGQDAFGRDRHPKECDCQRKRRETLEAAQDREHKHREEVERLKRKGFTDPAMREWTFRNDNGKCPQMCYAHEYVECWGADEAENHGLILWGSVGTGKLFCWVYRQRPYGAKYLSA